MGSEHILGAVGVLQFDVTMERLKAEYGVDAVYEPVDLSTARWIGCRDAKRLKQFERENQGTLARDAEGNLAYLAANEWRLGRIMEQWEDVEFHKTREHS